MNLLASIASIRKLCGWQLFENEEEIEIWNHWKIVQITHKQTNWGKCFVLCCTTLTNNMYCRSKARLILTGEVSVKWLLQITEYWPVVQIDYKKKYWPVVQIDWQIGCQINAGAVTKSRHQLPKAVLLRCTTCLCALSHKASPCSSL